MMEDVGTNGTACSRSDSGGPIRKASSATDKEDNNLIYNQECFRKNKARRCYDFYYRDCRIIIEQGVVMSDFIACAPRVRAMLDAQGLTKMVKDHRPAVEEIVREFYANLHQRCDDSFLTWVKGKILR
jgi:hypothetical protein